jgi:hypothetical protein
LDLVWLEIGRNDVNSPGAINTCCASAFTSLRVQIAFASGDVNSLRTVNTYFVSAVVLLGVLIADSISQTGGADLADHRHQTKNPASWEAGFFIWYQWPDSNRHAFKGGGF